MQLDNIFRRSKYRKTEPTSIIMCRNFVMIIILALLIGYTILLIINIRNDVPILKTESRTENSLRLPTVNLEFDYNFFIGCGFGYNSKLTEHTRYSFLSLDVE